MSLKVNAIAPLAYRSTVTLLVALCCLTFSRAADHDSVADAAPRPSQDRGGLAIVTLEEKLKAQEQNVWVAQEKVDALRRQLGGIPLDDGIQMHPDTIRLLEKEQITSAAQAARFQALHTELLRKTRDERLKMLPTVAPDQLLLSLLERSSHAETELARVSARLGPDAAEFKPLNAALTNLNKQLDTRIRGILDGIAAQAAAQFASATVLQKRVEEAKARDAAAMAKFGPYFRAKRDLESQQRIRETIMLRLLQEKVDADLPPMGQGARPPHRNDDSGQVKTRPDVECVLNLKKVGLAARIWAMQHGNRFPRKILDLPSQTDELSPSHLICPSDPSRRPASDWQTVTTLNIGYELLSPGAEYGDSAVVYAWCPIHRHALFTDGSVQMNQQIRFDAGKFVVN